MAERNASSTPAVAGDTIDYQPLSLLAVAGLSVAVVYALVIVIGAGMALSKGEPFFLGLWALALPVAGAVLSGLGLWEIYNSEGTRAGLPLAKWGLGLSLVIGLAFFAYQTAVGDANKRQSNDFLTRKDDGGRDSGFLPRLSGSENDLRIAFSFMLPASERANLRFTDDDMIRLDTPLGSNPKGRWIQFQESPLVRAMRDTPDDKIKIEWLAVNEWSYENRAYHIVSTYRITTEEAVYKIPITVISIEPSAEGEKRKWKVDNMGALQIVSRTEVGQKKYGYRQKALTFLDDHNTGWLSDLTRRKGLEVYLGTKRPEDRQRLRKLAAPVINRNPWLTLLGAPGTDTELLLSNVLPDYLPLTKVAEFFKTDKLRPFASQLDKQTKAAAHNALAYDRLPGLQMKITPDELAKCEFKDGEVQVTYQFELMAQIVDDKTNRRFDTILLGRIVLAASDKLDPTAADADQQWRVLRAEFVRALQLPSKQF
jgi:hypothetical protein